MTSVHLHHVSEDTFTMQLLRPPHWAAVLGSLGVSHISRVSGALGRTAVRARRPARSAVLHRIQFVEKRIPISALQTLGCKSVQTQHRMQHELLDFLELLR
jgi:hypothetical protein